jgi:hypothetical protein
MEARISFLSFAKILIATLAMTFLFIGNIHACPLHDAVSCGDVNAVSKLLESGDSLAEEDKAGRTPFSYAVQRHHTQIIRLLIITAITQSGVDMTTTLDIQETPEQASNEIIQPLAKTR